MQYFSIQFFTCIGLCHLDYRSYFSLKNVFRFPDFCFHKSWEGNEVNEEVKVDTRDSSKNEKGKNSTNIKLKWN